MYVIQHGHVHFQSKIESENLKTTCITYYQIAKYVVKKNHFPRLLEEMKNYLPWHRRLHVYRFIQFHHNLLHI